MYAVIDIDGKTYMEILQTNYSIVFFEFKTSIENSKSI